MSAQRRPAKSAYLEASRPSRGPEVAASITNTIVGVDEVARTSERRWGINRLPLLVSDATRLKFHNAATLWRQAVAGYEQAEVERIGAMMRRAWAAMEAEATALGHAPATPAAFETLLDDGVILVVARTTEDAGQLAADDRKRVVISMEEVGRLYQKQADAASAVLVAFPGARVKERSTILPDGYGGDWATGTEPGFMDLLYQDAPVSDE